MARRGDGIYLRERTWWLAFMHEGKRHYARLGKGINRTAAAELAAVKRAAILKGEAGIGGEVVKDLPLDKAVDLFLKLHGSNLKPRTRQRYEGSLRLLVAAFPGQKVLSLSPLALERYKRDRLAGGAKPATVNRDLEALRNCCNYLVAKGKVSRNPVRLAAPGRQTQPGQVAKLKEPEGRVRFLSEREEDALLKECRDPQLRAVVLLGIHAGLRIPSEALSLTWENVDLSRGSLTVLGTHSKTSRTRTIPVNSVLREALRGLRMGGLRTGPVFRGRGKGQAGPAPLRSVRTAFDTARERAGLGKDVTPHVLRHTFASRLVMAGVDLRTVQELGGWRNLAMVQRYAHLSPSHLAEAVERLARRNFTTLLQTPDRTVAVSMRGRGGRVAEGGGLENRKAQASGVRILPPPPVPPLPRLGTRNLPGEVTESA